MQDAKVKVFKTLICSREISEDIASMRQAQDIFKNEYSENKNELLEGKQQIQKFNIKTER